MVTVNELELLCGYEFDESDSGRAEAVIRMVSASAEGIIGIPIDLIDNDVAVNAAITSACLRIMQNKSGVSTETIGGFTAQYPAAGRIFFNEEIAILKSAKPNTIGTTRIVNPYIFESVEDEES